MPGTEFTCPRTSEACPIAELCTVANAPLVGAVRRVMDETTGRVRRPGYAERVLIGELTHTGHNMAVDFAPAAEYPDVTICPGEIIERDPPAGLDLSKEQIAAGVGLIVSNCVDGAIRGLNVAEQARQRRQQ